MSRMIFVNLPVKDVPRATAFYTALGFEQNTQFSNESASCIVVSEAIFVLLLHETYFGTFTDRPIVDATQQVEVINALSAESKSGVDELLSKALAAGGRETREANDQGFMYGRAFQDPDGHLWEVMWMDAAAVQGQ